MRIRITDKLTGRQMREVKKLYQRAFPKEERKPFALILKLRREGRCEILHFSLDNEFLGLAITIRGEGLVLVDYFAVTEERRGQGVGSLMMEEVLERYTGMGVFLEIECPKGDGGLTDRRLEFYRRAGYRELSVRVKLFGVDMILLGVRCTLSFEEYLDFYCKSVWHLAYKHIFNLDG